MLKQVFRRVAKLGRLQPPSGGCVLKQLHKINVFSQRLPAAFGRLCVETIVLISSGEKPSPAAFGRLCVETHMPHMRPGNGFFQPPSGGCVLKLFALCPACPPPDPAAFGRLCVETFHHIFIVLRFQYQPPSGGCVLKQFKGNAFVMLMPSRLRAAVC